MISTFIQQNSKDQVNIYKEQCKELKDLTKRNKSYQKFKWVLLGICIFTSIKIWIHIGRWYACSYNVIFFLSYIYVFGNYWPKKVIEIEKDIFFKSKELK